MFTARFLQTTNRNLPCRSKLFTRRAAMRCPQVAPAQQPSDMTPDTVTPEAGMVIVLTEEATPTGIQPSPDDLAIAVAEPATEMPDAGVEAVSVPVSDVIEPSPVPPDTAVGPETASSVLPTNEQKSARKRKSEASAAPHRKRSRHKKSGVEDSDAGVAAVGVDPENSS